MGCRYTFQCPGCGYQAEVSGEGDAGFFAEASTGSRSGRQAGIALDAGRLWRTRD